MKVEMQKTECRELSDAEIDSVAGGLLGEIVQAVKEAVSTVSFEAEHLYNVLKYGTDPLASQH